MGLDDEDAPYGKFAMGLFKVLDGPVTFVRGEYCVKKSAIWRLLHLYDPTLSLANAAPEVKNK